VIVFGLGERTLHVIYDDRGADIDKSPCQAPCSDIFYRQSLDGGKTWGEAIPLFPTDEGSARAQIDVDRKGVIYAAWDEGWDRLSGVESSERYGVFMLSADNGGTWSDPTLVTYPDMSNTQLTVGSDGDGGVMLVWRTIDPNFPAFYAMWSTDYGKTWTPPKRIPGLLSRDGDRQFDMYDMATDGAGNIHLLVVGYLDAPREEGTPPAVYHLYWDGSQWSPPFLVFEGTWHPEYPRLAIHQGNLLHATWFVRQTELSVTEPHQVWYANATIDAPRIIPTPTVTPSPTIPRPTATPTQTPTPTATLAPELLTSEGPAQNALDSLYTEYDEVSLLLLSLLPAAAIIGLVVMIIRIFRR
jgi:hypothetical protein